MEELNWRALYNGQCPCCGSKLIFDHDQYQVMCEKKDWHMNGYAWRAKLGKRPGFYQVMHRSITEDELLDSNL